VATRPQDFNNKKPIPMEFDIRFWIRTRAEAGPLLLPARVAVAQSRLPNSEGERLWFRTLENPFPRPTFASLGQPFVNSCFRALGDLTLIICGTGQPDKSAGGGRFLAARGESDHE
jgi:hypothetical protein